MTPQWEKNNHISQERGQSGSKTNAQFQKDIVPSGTHVHPWAVYTFLSSGTQYGHLWYLSSLMDWQLYLGYEEQS